MKNELTKVEMDGNIVARDPKDIADIKTVQELRAKADEKPIGFVDINYKDRLEFLEKNGYDLTRDNFMNAELSVRTVKVKKRK